MPLEAANAPHAGATADAQLWLSRLNRDGYCIIRGAIAPELVEALSGDLADRFERTPFCEGGFYGERTKRFGGVLKRSAAADAFMRSRSSSTSSLPLPCRKSPTSSTLRR